MKTLDEIVSSCSSALSVPLHRLSREERYGYVDAPADAELGYRDGTDFLLCPPEAPGARWELLSFREDGELRRGTFPSGEGARRAAAALVSGALLPEDVLPEVLP